MFALTIDQRGSRGGSDEVPALLEVLAPVPCVLPFERTVGDEVQGLLDDPQQVVSVVVRVARSEAWWVGVGVGSVDQPLPTSARASRGPALFAAREAVERADRGTAGIAVGAGGDRDPDAATDVETVLQVLGRLVAERSDEGQAAVDAVRRHATQKDAAEELDVTPQAVSARLRVARLGDEERLRALAVRLLEHADRPVD